MNAFLIYLWGIADQIRGFSTAATVIIGIGLVVGLCFTPAIMAEFDVPGKTVSSVLKRGVCAALIFSALGVFVPSSNTVAAMVVIPAIAESDAIREDIPQLYDAAIEKLKESLELTPTVEN